MNSIILKSCSYGCGTRIYWNNEEKAYFKVFSGKRHQCPNHQQGKKSNIVTQMTTNTTIPNYYSKKSYFATQSKSKPKMSNSLELLSCPLQIFRKI